MWRTSPKITGGKARSPPPIIQRALGWRSPERPGRNRQAVERRECGILCSLGGVFGSCSICAPPCEEKYGASYRLGRATVGCNNTTKFSEVQTVASRNSLYRILAINVALGVGQRAKLQLYTTWIGLRKGPRGGDCYRELPRITIFFYALR
jgi:hypothetical protein